MDAAFFSFFDWALSVIWMCALIFGISRLALHLFRSGGAGRPLGSVIVLTLIGGLLLNWAGGTHWMILRFIDGAIGVVLPAAMGIGAVMLLADSLKPRARIVQR